MRLMFALLAILLFMASTLHAAEDLEAKVKENCSAKWKTDYRMVKYCIDQQHKAWGEVSKKLDAYPDGSEERRIINRCAAKWRGDKGGFDFRMVDYCSNKQLEAYRALQ